MIISGIGYDSHRFEKNKPMKLGGITIPYEFGFKAHSDGDVLCHAIIDGILGASGKKDIGTYFPDNDPKYKDANSLDLLKEVVKMVTKDHVKIQFIDTVIIMEKPKLSTYRDEIIKKLSSTIGISSERINIKAKTNEGMGFVGRGEGVAVYATITIERTFND